MRSSYSILSVVLAACLAALASPVLTAVQAPDARPGAALAPGPKIPTTDERLGEIRGTAVDTSGGVLPGANVMAKSTDGRLLATTVTNTSGEFGLDGLPAGPAILLFHLDGFVDSTAKVTIHPKGSTGVPQAMASIMASPNGSGQSIGNNSA